MTTGHSRIVTDVHRRIMTAGHSRINTDGQGIIVTADYSRPAKSLTGVE